MPKAFESTASQDRELAGKPARDWRKGMSDNVAWALLAYTTLQIFVTVHAMKDATSGTASLMPYIALAVLVIAIIPACRWFERRWINLSDEAGTDPTMAGAYRRDQLFLWAIAIGLPFLLTGLIRGLTALA